MNTDTARASSLLSAYRRTCYCVLLDAATLILRIDHHDAEVDRRLCLACGIHRNWSIVTPCNPRSQRLNTADNAQRLTTLHAELARRQVRWVATLNRDPAGHWPDEPGALLCDPAPGLAETLGQRFEQNAIVTGRPGAAPRLVWLSTATPQ